MTAGVFQLESCLIQRVAEQGQSNGIDPTLYEMHVHPFMDVRAGKIPARIRRAKLLLALRQRVPLPSEAQQHDTVQPVKAALIKVTNWPAGEPLPPGVERG